MPLKGFSVSRHLHALPMLAIGCLVLAACGNSGTAAESPSAAAPAADHAASDAAGKGYEVVLIEHPTPADGAFQLMREAAYKSCALAAGMLHVPVKPFPTLPEGYITQRNTYVSDGHSWMRKTEPVYRIDGDNLLPDKGCEVRIVPDKSFEVTIEHAGKQISVSGHDDGTTSVDSADDELGAMNAKVAPTTYDEYTETRTVAGVSLRCLPKTSPLISPTGLIDMCVYTKDAVVTTSDKKSIVLYSNVDPANADPRIPYTVITEVTSLKLDSAIDAGVFKAETYSK